MRRLTSGSPLLPKHSPGGHVDRENRDRCLARHRDRACPPAHIRPPRCHAAPDRRSRGRSERPSSSEALVRTRLEGLQEAHGDDSEEAAVIGAHLLLLEDPEFTGEIRERIQFESLCVEAAVLQVTEESAGMLESLDDEYLAARAADVRDVGNQLLRSVLGLLSTPGTTWMSHRFWWHRTSSPPRQPPSLPGWQSACAPRREAATSHIAVFARGMDLPAVVGVDPSGHRAGYHDGLRRDHRQGLH